MEATSGWILTIALAQALQPLSALPPLHNGPRMPPLDTDPEPHV